ncbi:MAG: tRNA-specific 2-thiouridylase, partial [Candidatus Berkelbacteria bacterium Licking1014_85]
MKCALSGGVDSAVSAALLKQKGFAVTAVFMKNFDAIKHNISVSGCTSAEDQYMAKTAAQFLSIPFYVVNFEREYQKYVLDYFWKEFKNGRTPNPDVLCNTFIKFGELLKFAKSMGIDSVATGHYARLRREILNPKSQIPNKPKIQNSEYKIQLLRGKDKNKDQSYFLWQLSQEQLENIIFPIGELTKPEVRKLAKKFKLPNAERKDSQGICFVGKISVNEFLKTQIKPKKGKVILKDGTI